LNEEVDFFNFLIVGYLQTKSKKRKENYRCPDGGLGTDNNGGDAGTNNGAKRYRHQ